MLLVVEDFFARLDWFLFHLSHWSNWECRETAKSTQLFLLFLSSFNCLCTCSCVCTEKKPPFNRKKQKGSTMRIVYILVPIRTQILALILLFIVRTDCCTTALSCLLVKWIGLIGYLMEAHPFTLCSGSRARGGEGDLSMKDLGGSDLANRTADALQMDVTNLPRCYTFLQLY